MDEKNKEKLNKKLPGGFAFAAPFFAVMLALTVVAFIIPLRPTQSYSEKRSLAEFPEFSMAALISGSYFDDINVWFSDTFPGREGWIGLAQGVEELHGFSDIVIHGELPPGGGAVGELSENEGEAEPEISPEPIPEATPKPTPEATPEPTPEAAPERVPTPTVTEAPNLPVEEWGGVDAGEGADIILGTVIQIEDYAFSYFYFVQQWSERYTATINDFAGRMEERGVGVTSVLIPTSVGVMVEKEYLQKLGCADHGEVIDYMYSRMSEAVTKVDVLSKLIAHNDEYIYFRTDHHWTALGAYYAYEAICEALDMPAAELSDFDEWDQGEFKGSFYYSCKRSERLRVDNVFAYNPPGELETMISKENNSAFPWTVLTDVSGASAGSKYMVFLAGDHPLTTITNKSVADESSVLVVKGSFGNPLVPYLTQNYRTVYAVDYRSYSHMSLEHFVDTYGVDEVIFLTTAAMVQSQGANSLLENLCR